MISTRDDVMVGLDRASSPVEWRISEGLVPYETALALMETRAAAIAVSVKRWVTLHGVALNIDCDLSHYAGIVPCGVSDPRYGITSLADLGHAVTLPEIDAALRREFEHLFGPVARGQVAADSLVPSFPAT